MSERETLRADADEKMGTYERIGAELDRERVRNPIDEAGRPRWLSKTHRRVLAPFSDAVYAIARLVRELSDDDLELLWESAHLVSSVNCGWADYEVAKWPWLQNEARYERQRRAAEATTDA